MRTWFKVEVARFYAIVINLLQESPWRGVRTTGELRHLKNLTVPQNPDSAYASKDARLRKQYRFKPLSVPAALQRDLPYSVKPKLLPKKETKMNRVAVVRDPQDKKVDEVIKMIRATHREKRRVERGNMVKRVQKHKQQLKKVMDNREAKQKELKKLVFRNIQQKKSKAKH